MALRHGHRLCPSTTRVGWQGCVVGATLLALAQPARANVEGTAPAKVANWRLFGSHSATGAALLTPGAYNGNVNYIDLGSATADITDLPFDAQVEAAFLFWSGSTPRTNRSGPPDFPDRDVDFTTADGTFYNDLSVDSDPTSFGRCVTTNDLGGFYYCRRDVTAIVAQQGAGNAGGTYMVGDVDLDAGTLNNFDGQWQFAQAKYGAWSLLLVWTSQTEIVRRDIVLYDGFIRLDETNASHGLHTFSVGDFFVGDPALGKLTVFGMEGDRQLGVPPQDLDSPACPTCYDFIGFQGQSQATATKLSNGANPPNNSFNSSWQGQASIDIDTYNLFGLLQTADTSASITLGSGDGVVPGGNGESFFVGWTIMTLDTLTPSFSGTQTKITVLPTTAGAGATLFYTVDIVNEGSAAATGVTVQVPMPANASYVAGSTRIDGAPVADVGGASPLVAGLGLGTIPTFMDGDNSRQVIFALTVDPSACGGTVEASATIDASEIDPVTVGPAVATISPASLEPPAKRVDFLSALPPAPDTVFSYTITLTNSGNQDAGGVSVTDDLPATTSVLNVISPGNWSQAGTVLTVTNLMVSANSSVEVVILARVLSAADLIASGIAEASIDGLRITNQAQVSDGCGPTQDTDDPDMPGMQATEFRLVYAPVLSASGKTGSDGNGFPLEPLDEITYSIDAVNTGNRIADIVVTDGIPAGTTYIAGSTAVDGVPIADVGGQSAMETGLILTAVPFVGDNDRTISFRVAVDALIANGTVVQNSALLAVPVYPSANVTVTSPPLTVQAEPGFETSRKVLTPQGAYHPGDTVDYTIDVTNGGNRPGTSVVVTDTLPPELQFVSASAPGAFSAGVVTWNLGSVAKGVTVALNLRARVVTPLNNGTLVGNTALVTSAELAPFETPPAEFVVTSSPQLVVTKVDQLTPPAVPGGSVTYYITIANIGDMVAQDTRVDDGIPPQLINIAAPTGNVGATVVQWDSSSDVRLAALGPGDPPVELVMSGIIVTPLANGTAVTNQAIVSPQGFGPTLSDDPDVGGTQDPTVFNVVSQASLSVTKRVDDLSPATPPLPGDRLRYTFDLFAAGDAPTTDIIVTDVVDTSLTHVDISASSGSLLGNVITWSAATGNGALASLDPGAMVELIFEADIAAGVTNGTVISNQGTATSPELAADVPSDGDAAAAGAQPTMITVVSAPALTLTKTVVLEGDDDPLFNPGDTVRYTVVVRSAGTQNATGVSVTDVVEPNLTITDAGGAQVVGNTLSWSSVQVPAFASMPPGSAVTLSFAAQLLNPLEPMTIVNQAVGVSPDLVAPVYSDDPGLPGAADPTTFDVQSAPVLTNTTKTVADLTNDPLVTRPGDQLQYSIVVRNDGDQIADGVVVRDPIPANTVLLVAGGARVEGADLVWDGTNTPALVQLDAGAQATLTFTVQVDAGLANNTLVANQAQILSSEVTAPVLSDDPGTVVVDDPTRVTIVSAADLGGTRKQVTDLAGVPISIVRPNDIVRYQIVVSNRGDADASSVVVTDDVDPRLQIIAAGSGAVSGQRITWQAPAVPQLLSLAANDSLILSFDAQLVGVVADGERIINQGELVAAGMPVPVLTDADPLTLPKEETVLTVQATANVDTRTKVFRDPFSGAVIQSALPGALVQILITVGNTGDGLAPDVRVNDTLDTTILTSIAVRDGGSLVGDIARWGFDLNPGENKILRVDARVRSPIASRTLVNQALVGLGVPPTLKSDDPSKPGAEDQTTLDILADADFSTSTKDVTGAPARETAPGALLTYPIRIANTGVGPALNVTVTDPLAAQLEFISASNGGVYDAASRIVTWPLGTVDVNDVVDLSLVVRVMAGTAGGIEIRNRAMISDPSIPPEYTDDPLDPATDSWTVVTVLASPGFASFTKSVRDLDSVAPGVVRPGHRLEYTLDLRNDGNAVATNVEVRDILPTTLTNPQPVTPFLRQGATLIFNPATVPALGSVAPGAQVELIFIATIAATVANGTTIANQGSLSTAALPAAVLSDGDPSTPAVREPTDIVVSYPELSLTKTMIDINGDPVSPGDVVRFAITVGNFGPAPAINVLLTDPVDSALSIVAAPGWSQAGNALTRTLPTPLQSNDSATFTIDVQIPVDALDGEQYLNQATAAADNAPPVLSDWPDTPAPNDPVVIEVVALPSFSVTKTVSATDSPPGQATPGEELTYTIEIANEGQGDATNVLVRDSLPIALDPGGGGGQELTWTFASIARGANVTFDFVTTVRIGTAHGTVIDNQALVSAAELPGTTPSDDPTSPEPLDPTRVVVEALPRFNSTTLAVADLDGGSVQPGDVLRYTLRVVNSGSVDARDTMAFLPLPAYVAYIAESTTLNGEAAADVDFQPPFVTGLLVASAGAAVPGTLTRDNGDAVHDEWATVIFDARVDPRAAPGTLIAAQATITADAAYPTASDNPATPDVLGDATVLVVGGGAQLAVSKSAALTEDQDGDGRADIGDHLTYEIVVQNAGDVPALAPTIEDRVPAGAAYVSGTMWLDGSHVTDSADGDAGSALPEQSGGVTVQVVLGDLAPGAGVGLRFTVTVAADAGSYIANQAVVRAGGRAWLSDGDPSAPGIQKTITALDSAAEVMTIDLEASDVDGGVVEATDTLRYVVTVANGGAGELRDLTVRLNPSAMLVRGREVESGAAQLVGSDPPTWTVAALPGGGRVRIEYHADVHGDAQSGDVIEATASAETLDTRVDSDPSRLIVGGGTGTGAISGHMFWDRGERGELYDPRVDGLLEGFSVQVIPTGALAHGGRQAAAPENLSIRAGVADEGARFALVGLPAGEYVLWAMSADGVQYGESAPLTLGAGDLLEGVSFAIDPQGIIYQAVNGQATPVRGARVFLEDIATGLDVSRVDLSAGQQGQVTTGQGFYKFDIWANALPGNFRIRVEPPSANLIFPSELRRVAGYSEATPFGENASWGPEGQVVPHDFPNLDGDTTYFFDFAIPNDPTLPVIHNNHIPLDRLEERIRITKSANKRTVTVGEIVTYTVTAQNPTAESLEAPESAVTLVDDFPQEVRFVRGSGALAIRLAGKLLENRALPTTQVTARHVEFEPFRLPAHSVVSIRYYGVVGIHAAGEQDNRARLMLGSTLISNEANAVVRVVEDPVFDQGTVLGRVFCDRREGEATGDVHGLPGARVYLDTGYYADTDIEGKFHFRGVRPGRHLIKVDANTLPAASEPDDPTRELLLTRGLLAKVDFAVACKLEPSLPTEITLPHMPPPPPKPTATVRIDPTLPGIALDGVAQPLPLVDAVLVADVDNSTEPDFASGIGLNLATLGKMTWHVRVADRVHIARWQISIFTVGGDEAWRVEGLGRPPARIPWELTADSTPFHKGDQLVYRIVVETPQGDIGEGQWRRLNYLADPQGAARAKQPLRTWRGRLFGRDEAKPTKELRALVKDLVDELSGAGEIPELTVEAHTSGGEGKRSAKMLLSVKQAAAVAKMMTRLGVPEGRVKTVGLGDTQPLMPNISVRGRKRNRRIIVKRNLPEPENTPAAPIAYPMWLRIGREDPGNLAEPLEEVIEIEEGEQLTVELRETNGRRVLVTRTFPFGGTAAADRASVEIAVSGSLAEGLLQIGSDFVPLDLLNDTCEAENESPALAGDHLLDPIRFRVGSPAPLDSWLIRLRNPAGTVLRDLSGFGVPEEPIEWAGTNSEGVSIVRSGGYAYRCMMSDIRGNRSVSRERTLRIGGAPEQTPEQGSTTAIDSSRATELILDGDAYPVPGQLGKAAVELAKVAAAAIATPGTRVRIEVHDNAEGGKMKAQLRTARMAKGIKGYMLGKGVPAQVLDVVAFGANRPLMPGSSRRARKVNRRLVVQVSPPAIPPAPDSLPNSLPNSLAEKPSSVAGAPAMGTEAPASASEEDPPGVVADANGPRVRINGKPMQLAADGAFAGSVVTEPDATLVVDIATGDGRTAIYNVTLFEGRPLDVGSGAVPSGFVPAPGSSPLGHLPASLIDASLTAVELTVARVDLHRYADHPSPKQSIAGAGVDAVAGWRAEMRLAHLEAPTGPTIRPEPSGPTIRPEPSGPAIRPEPSGPGIRVEPTGAGSDDGALVAAQGAEPGAAEPVDEDESVTLPYAEAPEVLAGSLLVTLPADGTALRGERLTVTGTSRANNVIRINGAAVAVDALGRFVETLVLPPGKATVEVTSRDEEGNVARLRRTYTVPDFEWFLLAMADGAVGIGSKIEGMNEDTAVDLGHDIYLHGRAVAYLKGRIKGKALLDAMPFETLRLTAHLDTGKQRTSEVLRQLIDPERYYPVYGDQSKEVQDVTSRGGSMRSALGVLGKLYVRLEADKSRLTVGNFRVQLQGLDLFRYRRSHFGASLDLDEQWNAGHRTEVHAFAATSHTGMRHRELILQGTGGSFFFLRDGDIYDGTERVRLVVRDELTGARLVEIPQARDVDYHVDYRQGRLTFSQPIPSTVTAGWQLNQNSLRTLQGHALYVEVDYDYDATNAPVDGERGAFGFQVRHTFSDLPLPMPARVTVGGGVVDEDRSDQTGLHYRLYGAEARLKLFARTSLDAEVAHSQSVDQDHLASFDGGTTYDRLGAPERSRPGERGGVVPAEIEGWAGKLQLAGDVAEFFDLPFGPTKPGKPVLPFVAYAQHQGPGFFAGSSIMEQGQSKIGAQVRAQLSDADRLRLRHDAIWSWLFLDNEDRHVVRQITTIGYDHKQDDWSVGAEFGYNYGHDGDNADHTGRLSLFGEKGLVLPGLVGLAAQEVILFGGDQLRQGLGARIAGSRTEQSGNLRVLDRFATTVGARYKLTEKLWLTATESVRWTGSNSTQVGLRSKLGDDLSFYVNERLTAGNGNDPLTTTILGAESQAIPGSRSYAEYQLDTLARGDSGRAVLGMDNKWTIDEGLFAGLTLNLAYERSQRLGSQPLVGPSGSSFTQPSATGYGAGALAPDRQFAASGYSSGTTFPVGVASRDAFSIGGEYLHRDDLKAGLTLEMRYDRADDQIRALPQSQAFDRLTLYGQGAVDWRFDRLLVALGRVRGATVHNLDAGFDEGQFLDISIGAALRPAHTDDWGGLLRWTRRYERTPVRLDLTEYQLDVTDVVALEPYYEIGGGFQIVGKLALKLQQVFDAQISTDGATNGVTSTTILALARVNYHLTEMFDAGVEYRWLGNMLIGQSEHGALVEFAWSPVKYAAVGVGYNFTNFTDDLLARPSDNHQGFFLRVTGRY